MHAFADSSASLHSPPASIHSHPFGHENLRYFRADALFAGRTPRDNDASTASRNGRRFVYKVCEVVTLDFFLECG